MDIGNMYSWPPKNDGIDFNHLTRSQAKEIQMTLILKDFIKRYGIVEEGSKGYGKLTIGCPEKIYILFSIPINSEISDDRAFYKHFNNIDMRNPQNLIAIYKNVSYDYIESMFTISADEDMEVGILYGTSEEARNRYKKDMMDLVKEKIRFACKRRPDDIWTNEKYDNEKNKFMDMYNTPEYETIFRILAE